MEYIATRPSVELAKGQRHGLFTLAGDADMGAELQQIRDHKDSIKWSQIISLSREDAERMGFDNRRAWQNLIRAKAPEIAKAYNITLSNLVVDAAFHDKDHHPHVHVLFYSKDKREGYVKNMKQASKKMRSLFFNEIFREDVALLKEHKTEQRQELDRVLEASLKRLYSKNYSPPAKLPSMLLSLSDKLNKVSGKKVYGFLPPVLKQQVNDILRYCVEKDSGFKAVYENSRSTQREFVNQYIDNPEFVERRMQKFEQSFFEPGKNDLKQLHNTIVRYAVLLGDEPDAPAEESTVQKEKEDKRLDFLPTSADNGNDNARQYNPAIASMPAHSNETRKNNAAYAAVLLIRELAYSLGRDARQDAYLYGRNHSAFHLAQVRRKFTLHRKPGPQRNIAETISFE